jgi:uncharacterized protein (TIGR02444 family)
VVASHLYGVPIVAEPESFPPHPFWPFSIVLYTQEGVADTCLTLQDEYGLDVNLVLFCIWTGMRGPGVLEADELSECIARAGRWQTEVVERIRYVRRTLKQDLLGADSELVSIFRPKVQALEIDGERVEQLMLGSIVPLERGLRGREQAEQNLNAYLAWAGVDPAGDARSAVELVFNAGVNI